MVAAVRVALSETGTAAGCNSTRIALILPQLPFLYRIIGQATPPPFLLPLARRRGGRDAVGIPGVAKEKGKRKEEWQIVLQLNILWFSTALFFVSEVC